MSPSGTSPCLVHRWGGGEHVAQLAVKECYDNSYLAVTYTQGHYVP